MLCRRNAALRNLTQIFLSQSGSNRETDGIAKAKVPSQLAWIDRLVVYSGRGVMGRDGLNT